MPCSFFFTDPFLPSTSSFLPSMVSFLPFDALFHLFYIPFPTFYTSSFLSSMVSFLPFNALFLLFYRPFPSFCCTSPATASFLPSMALFLHCSGLLLTHSCLTMLISAIYGIFLSSALNWSFLPQNSFLPLSYTNPFLSTTHSCIFLRNFCWHSFLPLIAIYLFFIDAFLPFPASFQPSILLLRAILAFFYCTMLFINTLQYISSLNWV